MTRTTIVLLTSAAMVIGSAVTLTSQGKKGSTPKPMHVTSAKTTTVKVSSPKTTSAPKVNTSGPKKTTVSATSKGPKTTTVKAAKPAKTTSSTKSAKANTNTKTTTKLARTDTKAAKVDSKTTAKADAKSVKTDAKTAKSDAKTAKAETKTAKADSKTATTETTEKKTTTTTTTSGDGDDTPVTLTKVQEKLQQNTKLAEKLEGRLPKGTDLMEAADGFRNLGQFVAAVNVSNNLGLDFEQLKTAMVDDGKSLGQAIQYVKQDVESPTTVATRAETDAQRLIQETERTTTTATTTTKTKSKDKPKRTLRTTQSGS